MNNKVVIIIPYFGKFPNYFEYWLKSALYNPGFDFMIFTDNTKYRTNKNIKFINITFKEFKSLLQNQIEFSICLNEPYKLCDYRPIYGCALQNYISKYDFWGFGDIDVILGNLSHFIKPEVLNNYDKIYELGHLTLLRNNYECNNLWKIKHYLKDVYRYDEAFKTPYSCHFDENGGLTQIAKLKNIKTYRNIDFADIDRSKFNFVPLGRQNKVVPSLFSWKNGELDYYSYDYNNEILKIEMAYAHFQKRIIEVKNKYNNPKQFLIIPNQILDNADPNEYLTKVKVKNHYSYYHISRKKEIYKNFKNHAIQQRIYRKWFRTINRLILDSK